jgi:hypothetical protein
MPLKKNRWSLSSESQTNLNTNILRIFLFSSRDQSCSRNVMDPHSRLMTMYGWLGGLINRWYDTSVLSPHLQNSQGAYWFVLSHNQQLSYLITVHPYLPTDDTYTWLHGHGMRTLTNDHVSESILELAIMRDAPITGWTRCFSIIRWPRSTGRYSVLEPQSGNFNINEKGSSGIWNAMWGVSCLTFHCDVFSNLMLLNF